LSLNVSEPVRLLMSFGEKVKLTEQFDPDVRLVPHVFEEAE
jgi:hypothetical protein